MKRLLCASVLLIFGLGACATYRNYDRFENVETISSIKVTCSRPYELTQDCSNTTGATKRIIVKDLKLSVFGNQGGDVVGVMTRSIWGSGFKKVSSIGLFNDNKLLHDALGEVEKVLEQNSIGVEKKILMKSFGTIDGFFLELDGDGYSALEQFEVKESE